MTTKTKPRILLWDLETAGVNAFYADLGAIVNFGYMWLNEGDAECLLVSDYKGWHKGHQINDKPLIKDALKIMAEADLLVAHYGDKFDKRFLQGRCAIQGLEPPSLMKQRDTWRIAKGAFAFSSNRLGNLAVTFGLSEKKMIKERKLWPEAWNRVLGGDPKAAGEIGEYCKQDVRTLAKLYLAERMFDNANHPRLYEDRSVCGLCGSPVQYRGTTLVGMNRYRKFQCTNPVCKRWDRERTKLKIEDLNVESKSRGRKKGTVS